MSIARIPTIRAKVARQAQLVRRLALETSATQTTRHPAQPSRSLARSLGAPAALLLSVSVAQRSARLPPPPRRQPRPSQAKRSLRVTAPAVTSKTPVSEARTRLWRDLIG